MRIGILGGTFNPIHKGHLRLASHCRHRLKLDKVIFVPVNIPPHKSKAGILPAKQRYKMVAMAIKPRRHFEVSDYEIKSGGTSYSIRMLKAFRRKFGKRAKLFFLAGTDSAPQLSLWKDINKIIKLADFIVASRPGHKLGQFPGIRFISIPTPNISSTAVRRRLRRGLSVKKLLPAVVGDYIIKKGLYR